MRPGAMPFKTKADAERFSRLLESEVGRGVFVHGTEAQRSRLAELIDRHFSEVTSKKKSARPERQDLNSLKLHIGAFSPVTWRSARIVEYWISG
jgi:hypothetical protein